VKIIEAILPLKIHAREGATDLERFSTLFLRSFDCFFSPKELLRVVLLVPSADLKAVSAHMEMLRREEIRVVCEDDVCPGLKGQAGWYKQQILKLAAATIVSSDYYLTLDADIVFKRPTTIQDLFPSGKPILQKMNASVHWDWWLSSQRILKSNVHLTQESIVMGVTPEFLHRETCRALQDAIASRNNSPEWDRFLFDSRQVGWTEYSLYWLYVLEQGLERQLYDWSPKQMYDGIWERKGRDVLSRRRLQQMFRPDSNAFFLVAQSNLNLKLPLIQRRILPYLSEHSPAQLDTHGGLFKRLLGHFTNRF
jgi:hypothetical protein